MALSDPFHAVKAEVTQNAGAAEALAARWQQLEGDKRAGDERSRLRQQLSDLLLGVSADLEDLEETIAVVEKSRSRFRIDDEELDSRRAFIRSMRALVDSIYRSVDLTPAVGAGGGGGGGGGGGVAVSVADDSPPSSRGDTERVGLLGGGSSGKPKVSGGMAQAKSSMMEGAQQMQQMQMEQQDDLLEGLSSVVGRLKEQGNQMNREVRVAGFTCPRLPTPARRSARARTKRRDGASERPYATRRRHP